MKNPTLKRYGAFGALAAAAVFVFLAPTPKGVGEGTATLFFADHLFLTLLVLFALVFLPALAVTVAQRLRRTKIPEGGETKSVTGEDVRKEEKNNKNTQPKTPKKTRSVPGWVKTLLVLVLLVPLVFFGIGETIVDVVSMKLQDVSLPQGFSVPKDCAVWVWIGIIGGVWFAMLRGYVHEALYVLLLLIIVALVI